MTREPEEFVELLSPRQRQVLQLIVSEGLTHREIALRLGIGYQTVKNYMVAIYDKLCVRRRVRFRAIVAAWQRGEISLEISD